MKNQLSAISPDHWRIVFRIIAAICGGYLVTTLTMILIGLLLRFIVDTSQAIHIGLLLSFAIYTTYAMYCFHAQSVKKLWQSLFLTSLILSCLIYMLEQVIS